MQYSHSRVRPASQVTAAKVMDVITRPPGCAGQAADAVSAFTQVKNKDAPKLLKISPGQNVQKFGYVYHDTSGQHLGPTWKTQLFLSNVIDMVHPLALLQWERHFAKKFYWDWDGWEYPVGIAYWCLDSKGLFLLVDVDDIKNGWKRAKPRSNIEEIDEIG